MQLRPIMSSLSSLVELLQRIWTYTGADGIVKLLGMPLAAIE